MTYCFATSFSADQVQQIRVNGFDANLIISAKEGQNLVLVSDGISAQINGDGALDIELPKPSQLSTWRQWLFGQGQKVSFEIISPSKKLSYYVYQGSLTVKNWQNDIVVQSHKAKLNLNGGRGRVSIYNQKGENFIENQVGSVSVDGYSGSGQFKSITGDLKLKLFSGIIGLEKVNGHLEVEMYDGQIRSANGVGTFEFDLNRGQLNINSQMGRIEGVNIEGQLNLQMMNDSDLYISSRSGKVTISTPPGSGMSYLLATQDGEVWVADTKIKGDGAKSLRGKLLGQQSRGNIVVRGQDVNINLK